VSRGRRESIGYGCRGSCRVKVEREGLDVRRERRVNIKEVVKEGIERRG
jgi:hypothetical protein